MQTIISIPVNQIKPNQNQPRLIFDEAKIDELAESIRELGLIQPIVVRKNKEGYELIAGERRFRAVSKLGFEMIDAIVKTEDELISAQMALVENVQRENLSAIEEAKAYVQIMRQGNITQEAMAQKVGKTQSTVANKIRLLNLPEEIQEALSSRMITERHGRALLSVPSDQQMNVFEHVLKNRMNVGQTERYIQSLSDPTQQKKQKKMKTKGIVRQYKIAYNTIYQSVDMLKTAGVEVETEENETDSHYQIVIKFPKR